MNLAAGEKAKWPLERGRYGLHHAVVAEDIAYCAWRDGCLASVDVSDKANPKLIVHRVWSPPFGGGTHNCLPLPDRNLLIVLDEAVLDNMEDGFKPIWVFDNQVKSNPISISTFPLPNDRDYVAVGGHFGPHNIHENRPGSFQSSRLIFATYQNAGVRVYDIADPFRPVEVGACVPPAPKKLVDPAAEPASRAAFGRRLRRQERPLLLHRLERRRALHHGVSRLMVGGGRKSRQRARSDAGVCGWTGAFPTPRSASRFSPPIASPPVSRSPRRRGSPCWPEAATRSTRRSRPPWR